MAGAKPKTLNGNRERSVLGQSQTVPKTVPRNENVTAWFSGPVVWFSDSVVWHCLKWYTRPPIILRHVRLRHWGATELATLSLVGCSYRDECHVHDDVLLCYFLWSPRLDSAISHIGTIRRSMDAGVYSRSSRPYLYRIGCSASYLQYFDRWTVLAGDRTVQICVARREAWYLLVHMCYWFINMSCRWTLSTVYRHNLQVYFLISYSYQSLID